MLFANEEIIHGDPTEIIATTKTKNHITMDARRRLR